MGDSLVQIAEEQILQGKREAVIGFIKDRLARKESIEEDLLTVKAELAELNTLPLEEAFEKYNKYYNYEGVYRGRP